MATYPQKTAVATALTHRSNIPLSDRHISTTNFMELSVAKIMELVPRSSIDINMRTFARLDTMKLPTQGDCIVNSRAYFVPLRTIYKGWNDFIDSLPHMNDRGQLAQVGAIHAIPNLVFVESFINGITSSVTSNEYISEFVSRIDVNDSDSYDFTIPTYDSQDGYLLNGYRFTAKGARIFKLLCQLGYAIDFNLQNYIGFESDPLRNAKSALPLFSLLKIYIDHYYPSQYVLSDEYQDIQKWLSYDNPLENLAYEITYEDLRNMYDVIDRVCYDNDYFVSAWDSPNAPNPAYGSETDITVKDIANGGDTTVTSDNEGAYIESSDDNVLNRISQYALTALKSLSDYMKRHQIVGARVIDRYLSRWGVALAPEKMNRSVYIDDFKQSILFGDVTSTADTDGANLGAYAGKGIIPEKNAHFQYSTDEFGYFIILTSIVPVAGYYQGEDRMVNHIRLSDFYTPEFDNLGTQAIGTRELYVPMNSARQYANNIPTADKFNYDQMIFGFTPRYAEYKTGRDKLTGDFRLGSKNTSLDGWHLFRNMDDFFNDVAVDDVSHDVNFVRGLDSAQYNRIFNYMGDLTDKIKISFYFDYKLSFPGRKLYDSYEFTDEDKAEKVSVDVGGSKAN